MFDACSTSRSRVGRGFDDMQRRKDGCQDGLESVARRDRKDHGGPIVRVRF